MGKQKESDLEAELTDEYKRWEYLKEYGGSDPFYDDSVNMNLTLNHIIAIKTQMEEMFGEDREKYPEIYFRELPPLVREGYMARADEIRDQAVKVLDNYLADVNFQYLLCNKGYLTEKEAKEIHIKNVVNYAYSLANALKEDNLVVMRRHTCSPENYLESFAGCAEKMKKILDRKRKVIPEKNCQMTLFQMGLEIGQCR